MIRLATVVILHRTKAMDSLPTWRATSPAGTAEDKKALIKELSTMEPGRGAGAW